MATEEFACDELALKAVGVTKLHAEITGDIAGGGNISVTMNLKTHPPDNVEKIDKDHMLVLEVMCSIVGLSKKGKADDLDEETFNISCTVMGKFSPWNDKDSVASTSVTACNNLFAQQLYPIARQHIKRVADDMTLKFEMPTSVRFERN